MSFICPKCSQSFNKDNVYGTLCTKCFSFIMPVNKPQIIKEFEEKKIANQNAVREYLKQKMLGDINGNKIQ